jgi:hypothetical protein
MECFEHTQTVQWYGTAMLFAVIAMSSLAFAIYVRIQPPTVIRVDQDGNAKSVSAIAERGKPSAFPILSAQAATDPAPTELEAKAVVRSFLEHYLAYTPATVDQNLATAFNMMTANLRTYSSKKCGRTGQLSPQEHKTRYTTSQQPQTPQKAFPDTYCIPLDSLILLR